MLVIGRPPLIGPLGPRGPRSNASTVRSSGPVSQLGASPAVIHVLAQVVHTRAITIDGQVNYVVGCQYTGRAEYEK